MTMDHVTSSRCYPLCTRPLHLLVGQWINTYHTSPVNAQFLWSNVILHTLKRLGPYGITVTSLGKMIIWDRLLRPCGFCNLPHFFNHDTDF